MLEKRLLRLLLADSLSSQPPIDKGWEELKKRGLSSTDPSTCTPSTRHGTSKTSRRMAAAGATGRHYALVAAKDGGPAAFVDRREATKLPDTHLKTWERKSKS